MFRHMIFALCGYICVWVSWVPKASQIYPKQCTYSLLFQRMLRTVKYRISDLLCLQYSIAENLVS